MSRKVKQIALGILIVLLILVWGGNWSGSGNIVTGLLGPERLDRFVVQNPTLRTDLLAAGSKLEYAGMKRNIFNFTALPPQQAQHQPAPPRVDDQGPPAPAPPPVDPPLVPPFKFYGYTVDVQSGRRRGFFTNGDDIWVAAEGEVVQRRFKLVSLSATRAEVEEIASGKRATLQIDESAAPSGGL